VLRHISSRAAAANMQKGVTGVLLGGSRAGRGSRALREAHVRCERLTCAGRGSRALGEAHVRWERLTCGWERITCAGRGSRVLGEDHAPPAVPPAIHVAHTPAAGVLHKSLHSTRTQVLR